MRDLTVRDIMDLVTSDVKDAEDRIQTMYSWHFEQQMTLIKFLIGGSGSLLAAVLIAVFKAEIKIEIWLVALSILGGLATAVVGIFKFQELKSIHRQHVATLKLYSDLLKIAPF